MQIFENDYIKSDGVGCVLALGNFDGVHIGHGHLLKSAKEYAENNGLKFGIYTFIDSPKFKNANHSVLTTLQQRLSLFRCGYEPDFVYLEKFDFVKDFEPSEFVSYIIKKFNCECTFCGDNFSFGKNASGKAKDLSLLMTLKGKVSVVVDSLAVDNITVSSTRIKELIKQGEVEKASQLLGEPYCIISKVIHGAHLGHTLGFPTINQLVPKELVLPKFGVYATSVIVDGKEYMGVTNFGVKPTVSNDAETAVAETFIIDFDGDVYDKFIGICFCKRLRDEKKFSSLDELKKSISDNVEQTKRFFEEKYEKK